MSLLKPHTPSLDADFESIGEEARTPGAFREWRGLGGELPGDFPESPANSLNPHTRDDANQESTNGPDHRSREAA